MARQVVPSEALEHHVDGFSLADLVELLGVLGDAVQGLVQIGVTVPLWDRVYVRSEDVPGLGVLSEVLNRVSRCVVHPYRVVRVETLDVPVTP